MLCTSYERVIRVKDRRMTSLPLFVTKPAEIDIRLASLTHVRDESWQSIYVNSTTNECWIKFPLYDYKSMSVCLRRGNPALKDILYCIQHSDQDEEVATASFYLVNDLDGRAENLLPLLDRLELLLTNEPNSRVLRNIGFAVAYSKAERAFNHRNPTGKSASEVFSDMKFFESLAERAAVIRANVESELGCRILKG